MKYEDLWNSYVSIIIDFSFWFFFYKLFYIKNGGKGERMIIWELMMRKLEDKEVIW